MPEAKRSMPKAFFIIVGSMSAASFEPRIAPTQPNTARKQMSLKFSLRFVK